MKSLKYSVKREMPIEVMERHVTVILKKKLKVCVYVCVSTHATAHVEV